jgi:choline dehydrogenase-like flavoprotein
MATHYDVVVIGAGASGAAASWRLASLGFSVCCLEQGDWVKPAQFPTLMNDWEIQRQGAWHPNPNIRKLPVDYPIDDSNSAIKPLLFNGVGGSTIMWSCHLPRFHAEDFTMRTDDGVGDDWPLSLSDIDAYYDLNESMMGVAGLSGNPDYNGSHQSVIRTPATPLGTAGLKMASTFDELGWSWWPADLAIRTGADSTSALNCNHCGPCELQCPRQAKASVDTRYWPAALKQGVKLCTSARVFNIETDKQSRVKSVHYYDHESQIKTVDTSAVFLAGNGIGSPRLLLMSSDKRHPNGLGNGSGLVGKRLMLHPLARVTGRFKQAQQGHRGITAGSWVSHHFYRSDPARGFSRGVKMQLLGTQGPALTANGSLGKRMPWGSQHHQQFEQWFDHCASLSICSDDLPEETNRIELDSENCDSQGLPGVKMTYVLGNNTRKALDYGIARASEAMRAAGADELIVQPTIADAGFHLMGTCSMGHDRDSSVVDRWCESHDCKGLFIIDGSAFVTAAAVNPTNTLQALALRASDYLHKTRSER